MVVLVGDAQISQHICSQHYIRPSRKFTSDIELVAPRKIRDYQ